MARFASVVVAGCAHHVTRGGKGRHRILGIWLTQLAGNDYNDFLGPAALCGARVVWLGEDAEVFIHDGVTVSQIADDMRDDHMEGV